MFTIAIHQSLSAYLHANPDKCSMSKHDLYSSTVSDLKHLLAYQSHWIIIIIIHESVKDRNLDRWILIQRSIDMRRVQKVHCEYLGGIMGIRFEKSDIRQ